MFVTKLAGYGSLALAKFGQYFTIGDTASNTVISDAQMTSIQSSLTSTVNSIVDIFVQLLPIIALTTGAIFAIRFIKKRFSKVEHTN